MRSSSAKGGRGKTRRRRRRSGFRFLARHPDRCRRPDSYGGVSQQSGRQGRQGRVARRPRQCLQSAQADETGFAIYFRELRRATVWKLGLANRSAAVHNQQQSDRLSWGDTVFLHLERQGMPLNVASVCVFEGEIAFRDCVRFVESKLPLLPRYFKRVVPAPFGLGLPTWEYDPEFDLRRHLREVTLKTGSD